jgi:hypothetical protein
MTPRCKERSNRWIKVGTDTQRAATQRVRLFSGKGEQVLPAARLLQAGRIFRLPNDTDCFTACGGSQRHVIFEGTASAAVELLTKTFASTGCNDNMKIIWAAKHHFTPVRFLERSLRQAAGSDVLLLPGIQHGKLAA